MDEEPVSEVQYTQTSAQTSTKKEKFAKLPHGGM